MVKRTALFILCTLISIATAIASGPFGTKQGDPRGPIATYPDLGGISAPDPEQGENNRLVASGLALLLGPFGAHRLYLGTTPKVAVVYGVTFAGFGTLVLLDLGHLLFSKDLERFRHNDRVFMWNPRSEEPTPP